MVQPYTNREIDQMVASFNQKVDDMSNSFHEKIDLVIAQTTKHNGRMTTAELQMAQHLGFFKAIAWGLGIFIPVVIGVSAWALVRVIDIPQTVAAALENYDIRITQ